MGRPGAVAVYTIGQVEEITGVKQHILRYWEEVIPSISPEKDISGRRLYSDRDVELVLRINHLVNEKKFTIEGARNQIVAESEIRADNSSTLMELQEIRSALAKAFFTVRKYRGKKISDSTENKEASERTQTAEV